VLEDELERSSAVRHRHLHMAAANLCLREGDDDAAIGHWMRAGRPDLAWERSGETLLGQFARGRAAAIEQWKSLSPRTTEPPEPFHALGLAIAQVFLGQLDDARRCVQRTERDLERSEVADANVEARLAFVQYLLAFAEGDFVTAARLGTRAHVLLDRVVPGEWQRLRAHFGRIRLLTLLGHPERARRLAATYAPSLLEAGSAARDLSAFQSALAGIALAEGNHADALQLAEAAIARKDEFSRASSWAVEPLFVRGSVRLAYHDLLDARTDLEAAIAGGDRQGFVHLRVLPRLALASVLAAEGDRTSAHRVVDEARALLPSCARVLHQRLERVAAHVAGAPDRRSRTLGTDPASELTAREEEVSRYLATGMSMREIATVLFISRNTLKSHVRSIYQKLGVGTREDAVAQRQALVGFR
jgi:ATP/maltotriose-dependent transcriptional regulator MalT